MSGELATWATMAALLLAGGLLAGLIAGLLGVGGGIVMVPILYQVFTTLGGVDPDVRMHMAVGTSLATMIPTSLRSAQGHRRRGAVDEAVLRRWTPAVLAGALVGVVAAAQVKGPVLMAVFAVFALLMGTYMLLSRPEWRLADALPGAGAQRGMAFAIGAVSVMMGIGGGSFGVPALTLYGQPIHRAVGTAAAVGVLVAGPGAIGFAATGLGVAGRPPGSLGYASLVGVALMIPATLLATPWGVALAHRLAPLWLRRAFALFLGLSGARMAAGFL